MRATAIRWNFREYRFLFTVVPFPETVPNFVCHFKGSLQLSSDHWGYAVVRASSDCLGDPKSATLRLTAEQPL